MHVVKFAYQVIEMQGRIDYLESEVERLRQYERKYHEEIDASIKHGEKMMGNWLSLLLSDRIKINVPDETLAK